MKFSFFTHKVHSWLSIVFAIPVIIIVVTGLMIQLRKDWAWVQPTEQKGTGKTPTVTPAQIFDACKTAEGSGVSTWADISRIDYRTGKGLVKVTTKDNMEVQIDASTGAVLQVAFRRSDLLNSIHEGAWFDSSVKYYVFLPAGVGLLFLWCSGMYLFFYPRVVKWRRQKPVTKPQP